MKNIALCFKWNRTHSIRIFIDVEGSNEIYRFFNVSKVRKVELYEIFEMIYDGIVNSEKYRKIRTSSGLHNYFIMVLSRDTGKACILCKEKTVNRKRYIVLTSIFKGTPDDVIDSMREMIEKKGGIDYEFKG